MKFLSLIAILFIVSVILYPEDKSDDSIIKLDIDSAVAKAIEHNFSLKNSRLDNDNYEITEASSFNKLFPSTGINATIGKNYSYQTTTYHAPGYYTYNENLVNTLSAGFSTSFNLNAKTFFDIKQTLVDYRYGLINYQNALNRLINDTRKFYYNLLILKEQVELQNNKVVIAKERYDSSFINNSIRVSTEIDILQNEYDYRSNLFELKKAEDSFNSSVLQLKQMLGIKSDKNIELTTVIPEITPIDYNEMAKQSIDKNLDLQTTIELLNSEQNYRNGYIASLTPSFSLSYSITSTFDRDPAIYNWFYDLNNLWDRSGSFNFTVSLPLDPLFPYSSSQITIAREQNIIRKIKNNINDQKEKLELTVVQTIIKLKETEENINILKTNIELADYAYQQIEKLYNEGKKSILDLRDADNTLYNAQTELLNARYTYITNMLDLKYLLNVQEK